ncbi:tripartite tricarboxylate transporter substrate binding protein [Roseococcus sp. SYP-B2431]|uniref:Bug family tripartite tricarboxylate transporter substrate binding protein n=1 Tax=Roseococcus sp. SYP-B2431 TaxID=2496640 RepID=UPI0010401213|nr:tripartite tricarboxylate transporter substrate binding protein [Roseococcus sp. SYP-B2431]TCH96322.1 tripartite tricarboxylate transporter substrate binding protein [Roseococcus sp. SYP-B2431]
MSPEGMSRRHILGAAAAGGALAAREARAQNWPERPIQLVIGFLAGGSNDSVARIIAPRLGELLGGTVLVDNRPGASGTIAMVHVARAEPNGYTLALAGASPLSISPHTYASIPYDTSRDFVGVAGVALTPEVICVTPNLGPRNLAELVELGKRRDLTFSSSGNGGLPHLAIELLRRSANIRIIHVPYRGAMPAAVDTISGQVNGIIMDLPPLAPLIREGKLRALAVASERRASLLPDLPTTVEQGFPEVLATNWFGVMAPARTPRPIIERLHRAITEVANSPEIQANFRAQGIEAMTMPTPQAFDDFVKREAERWGVIARAAGARAD